MYATVSISVWARSLGDPFNMHVYVSIFLCTNVWIWRVSDLSVHKCEHMCFNEYANISMCEHVQAFQVVLVVKNLPASARDATDASSIPGSGRSSGKGNGNPLQYSCLENPMDRGAWQATVNRVAQSQTQLKWLSTHACEHVHVCVNLSVRVTLCVNVPACSCVKTWACPHVLTCWCKNVRLWVSMFMSECVSMYLSKRMCENSYVCYRFNGKVWLNVWAWVWVCFFTVGFFFQDCMSTWWNARHCAQISFSSLLAQNCL